MEIDSLSPLQFSSTHLFGMTDPIRECYGTLCRTLNDLAGETALPGTIDELLKSAHILMSMLGDTARGKTWKVMKVMVHTILFLPPKFFPDLLTDRTSGCLQIDRGYRSHFKDSQGIFCFTHNEITFGLAICRTFRKIPTPHRKLQLLCAIESQNFCRPSRSSTMPAYPTPGNSKLRPDALPSF